MQYWYLLFTPPPAAKHAFQLSSDQWIDCGNWFWSFSLILQNWIAPSSSRCLWCEWRGRNVTFFDTSYSEKEYFPGSISIQFLLSMGKILGEEPASSLLCGFAFAFDRHAKSFALSFNAYSSSWSSGILFHIVAIELFYAGSSLSKGTSVLVALSTIEELDCPLTTGLTVLSWQDSYSSHISATAP